MQPHNKNWWKWWALYRQKARTDLIFLCNEILGYKDVSQKVHGPIIAKLQQFKGGNDHLNVAAGTACYEPFVDLWHLEGNRNFLVLDPRGFLKTTVVTTAHAIQWLINYPDVRILYSTATGDLAHKLMTEIRGQFQYNDKFRFLFPEFCPPAKRVGDFGNQEQFTVPNRRRKWTREPSVSVITVGKVIAGSHYEVIIHSDLVDKENVKTPGQLLDVIQHYKYTNPLLERSLVPPHYGWTYVEGTRYDWSDLYGEILEKEQRGLGATWNISVRPAEKDNVPLWPERYPMSELKRIQADVGDFIYSSQMLQKPVPSGAGLADDKDIQFVPSRIVKNLIGALRLHVTIDLHGMEDKASNDYTVLTLAGFDRDARMYVIDIRRGHFTPFEVIDQLFDLYKRYPQIVDFKIEKDAHARVLLPFLKREMSKRRLFPVILPLKRDNRTSKAQRIRSLQPWFKAGIIRFCDDISCRLDILQEIKGFPSYKHDDILDTLVDQMQNREGGAVEDLYVDAPYEFKVPSGHFFHPGRFMGFDPFTHQPMWSNEPADLSLFYRPKTGL